MSTNFAISKPCVVTGKPYTVFVNSQDFTDWSERKKLAQEAFPYLSKEDREFIISGISPDGWDEMFSDDASDES
jgi:hypothetical protein